jgi:hypothetical protein
MDVVLVEMASALAGQRRLAGITALVEVGVDGKRDQPQQTDQMA